VTTVLVLCCVAASARAQTAAAANSPKIVISAGVLASRGYAIGDRSAALRRNSTSTSDAFTLFRTESTLGGAPGLDARVAYAVSPRFSVEVAGTFSRPQLGIRITQDSEGAPSAEASESIDQYTVEGSGIVHLGARPFGRAVRPYLIGGGGYLRQLHDDRVLVETGRVAYGGGGLNYWLRGQAGRRRALGIRGEVCAVVRSSGIDFEDKARVYPRVSALGVMAF
jgi:hypothetical protein